MIDRSQLRNLHDDDLPLHILEQDYVQALFLQELYDETESIVFKGGTFLKHAHGLDRFSENLDFTHVDSNTSDEATALIDSLERTAEQLERYGLDADWNNLKRQTSTVLGQFRYSGPLYDGTDRSRGTIEIDVSLHDDIFLETEWQRLFFPYPETRTVTARCMALEEAFAEKLRALSTRTRGRDLYDTWFLLQQDVPIDSTLFGRKMDVVDAPPIVRVSVTPQEWNRDLSILLKHPPDYETVIETVQDALTQSGISVEIT